MSITIPTLWGRAARRLLAAARPDARPPATVEAPPWSWGQVGALALVAATCLCLGWMIRLPEIGAGEDEAVYLLLSESLADGHYEDVAVPGSPMHAKYPPGTATWILVVRTIAGGSLDAVRAANLILLVIAGLLLADGWRRLGLAWIGIGAAAITLWNPYLLQFGTTLSSEPPFLALSVAALWATLPVTRDTGHRWLFLSSALAIAGFLTRTAGLGLVVGIGTWGFLSRRWRYAMTYAVSAGIVVAGWFAYLRWAMPRTVAQTYAVDLTNHVEPDEPRLMWTVASYAVEIVPNLLHLPMNQGTSLDSLAHILIFGVAALVGSVLVIRRWPAAGWSLVATSAILLVWGWPLERLLLPLLPWIASAMLLGSRSLGARLPQRFAGGVGVPLVLGVALTAFGLQGSVAGARLATSCGAPDQYAHAHCTSRGERSLVQAARGLADSVAAEAIIVTVKPSTVHYFSRRTVIPLWGVAAEGRLDRLASGAEFPSEITHLLLTTHTAQERNQVATVLLQHCRRLAVAGQFREGAVLVSFDRSPGSPDACAALEAFRRAAPPITPE